MNQLHNSFEVWYRSVPDDDPDASRLSEHEIERAARFVRPVDQRRYVATRSMVRGLLSKYGSRAPGEWRFVTNGYGKPRIAPDQSSGIHFNVSHTSSIIVCAIASFSAIGVDVEERIPIDFRQIAHQYFTQEENDWLLAVADEPAAQSRFLTVWTLKEAYIKAVGQGLSIPLKSFSVVNPESGIAEVIKTPGFDRHGYLLRSFSIDKKPVAVAHPVAFAALSFELLEYSS